MLMLISLTSGTRFWTTLDPSERPLQVVLICGVAGPTLALLACRTKSAGAQKWRVLVTVTSRLFLSSAPSTRAMIARLASGEWRLGRKWGYSNSLGAVGLLLFTSRIGMLWFTAFGLSLNVVDTALVQTLILAAGWRTAPELCTAVLADATDVVAAMDTVHGAFNAAWTVAVPFPTLQMPPAPSASGRAAVSLAAVNSLVKVVSYLAPIVAAAAAEAEQHRRRGAERPAPAARRPSAPARVALALGNMRRWFPVHFIWAEVVAACVLWWACYGAADRMCAAAVAA